MLTCGASDEFQSPRRWGGVGLAVSVPSHASRFGLSFNPLGGGAGSGSDVQSTSPLRTIMRVSIPSEVGRGRAPDTCNHGAAQSAIWVSIPSEVGRGRARVIWQALVNEQLASVSIPSEVGRGRAPTARCPSRRRELLVVSIPSEVGRGRAQRSLQRLARHELGERFSVSSRKRYKTRLAFSGTRVSWKTQETRAEQVAAGRNRGPKSG